MIDNAFITIEDWSKAQKLSDNLSIEKLHKKLNVFAQTYCPVHKIFKQLYHWSIMQCEYCTDIVFTKQGDLKPLYEQLIAKAIIVLSRKTSLLFLARKCMGNMKVK